jgi:hypothetical protein
MAKKAHKQQPSALDGSGGSLRLDACELHQFVFFGQPGVLFIDRNKSVNGW